MKFQSENYKKKILLGKELRIFCFQTLFFEYDFMYARVERDAVTDLKHI